MIATVKNIPHMVFSGCNPGVVCASESLANLRATYQNLCRISHSRRAIRIESVRRTRSELATINSLLAESPYRARLVSESLMAFLKEEKVLGDGPASIVPHQIISAEDFVSNLTTLDEISVCKDKIDLLNDYFRGRF